MSLTRAKKPQSPLVKLCCFELCQLTEESGHGEALVEQLCPLDTTKGP